MLLGSGKTIAFIAFAIAALLAYNQYADLKAQLDEANALISHKDAAIEALDEKNLYLKQSVNLSEAANARLMREREVTAKVNAEHEKKIYELQAQHAEAQTKISKLRLSNEKPVKDWAVACVPNNAISLLKYATFTACERGGDTNRVQVHNSTSKHVGSMPGEQGRNKR